MSKISDANTSKMSSLFDNIGDTEIDDNFINSIINWTWFYI